MQLLHYKIIGEGTPILIIHGLFGSLDNWQSIAKNLSLKHKVITIDLRNHGRSFHHEQMSFDDLNHDILYLLDYLKIEKTIIIGHSLGGKIGMNFATSFPDKVFKLIVVDVAPYKYPPYHMKVFGALLAVPIETIDSRQEVENIFRKHIDNELEIQFLMKGLSRKEHGGFEWKFNLNVLYKEYLNLIQHIPLSRFNGPTLFIKGGLSDYISIDKIQFIYELFPNYEIEEIKNSGHWVHADNPLIFIRVVQQFITRLSQ